MKGHNAPESDFSPYLVPRLAGTDGYEWFAHDPISAADSITLQHGITTCLRALEKGPFFVGLVDDHARLTYGIDRYERCSAYFFADGLKEFLGFREIAYGSHIQTHVHPQMIARHVVELNASGVIIVHSHPLADARPSDADLIWVASVAQYLPFIGAQLYDSLIVSGLDICSQLELRKPAEAWPEVVLHKFAKDEDRDPAPEITDAEASAINLAKGIILQHLNVLPPEHDCAHIVRLWMSARLSAAIGVIALDACRRPLRCEIIGGRKFSSSTLVSAIRFAVRTQAVELIFVMHRRRAPISLIELKKLAAWLSPSLKCFGTALVGAFRSGVVFDQITSADWQESNSTSLASIAAAGVVSGDAGVRSSCEAE